jgi:hypothetical protein
MVKELNITLLMIMIMIMFMEWDYVSKLQPPTVLLLIPRWYMNMEGHGGMISKETPWFVHQSSLAVLTAESSRNKSGGTWRRKRILPSKYLCWYSEWFIKCRNILRHANYGFTSPPKEGVLQICITLKNPSPRPGFNPRTLGPMASTLSISPPRRLT